MTKPTRIKNREQAYLVDVVAGTVTHVPTGAVWAVAPARSARDQFGAGQSVVATLPDAVKDRRSDAQIGPHPAQARGVTAWVLALASGCDKVQPQFHRQAADAWIYRARLDRERPRPL